MGKKDILNKISKEAGITLSQAQRAFGALLDGMKDALNKGGKINLSGFGSFEVRVREARKGRNPKTGVSIQIPQKRRIKFNPSRSFKHTL